MQKPDWFTDRPKLKLTGYRTTEEIEDIFGSNLVDVAYVFNDEGELFVVADDSDWPQDDQDLDWLCSIIKTTLAEHDLTEIELLFIPKG